MGVSTDGIAWYGYHLESLPEALSDDEQYALSRYGREAWEHEGVRVVLENHCTLDDPMHLVAVHDSFRTAARGYPEPLPDAVSKPVPECWDAAVRAFAEAHGLVMPGERDDEYSQPASQIGWWLASLWG